MADLKDLEEQLDKIGCNFRFWGRSELRELANVLLPDETVEVCVNGRYDGGFAMLVATNQRVLLIDKKPLYLTLEDIRFDMVAEVDYNHRLLSASISICTPNKSLCFIAYNHERLRKLFQFVQERVMEIRQHYQQQSQVWSDYANGLKEKSQPATASARAPMAALAPEPTNPVASSQLPVEASIALGLPPTEMSAGQEPMPAEAILQAHPPAYPPMSPLVGTYTRLPVKSQQRRLLGSHVLGPLMTTSVPPK